MKQTRLNIKTEPKPEPQSNDIVGPITGRINSDNSFKISGGSVLMSSNRVNPQNTTPKNIRDKNKQTLVRTVF